MNSILKSIFIDISLLFRNILHWNISKALIFIWGTILGFLALIPFAIIFFIYSYFSGISFFDFTNSLYQGSYMTSLYGNIIYILALGAYSISYFFTFILFIKLNYGYLKGEKITYLKNSYFDYKLYFKFLLLTLGNIIILIIPVLLFIFIFGALLFLFGGVESSTALVLSRSNNLFSVILFILFIVLVIKLYYLFFRFIFSYFILIENKEDKLSIVQILKKSYNITKGFKKFLKFTLVLFITLVIYLPFGVISTYINGNYSDLNSYGSYLNLEDDDRATLKGINTYFYEGLELKYTGKDLSEIESLQNRYYIFSNMYSIFEFIFIFGVFTMVLNSIYIRVLKSDINTVEVEKDNEKIRL